ncbi:hypothetical protein GCM10027343_34110 [Noviherbaspirillum agri]
MTPEPEPLIDAAHAAFLQQGISMCVAACSQDNIPTLVRGTGCRISPDRRRVTVFVSAIQAAPVLQCIRNNGSIAVVFSEPSTHRTVQLKGTGAVIGTPSSDDLVLIERYCAAFSRELQPLGFAAAQILTLLAFPPEEIVSLSFTPAAAFSQTPGPKAGEPLKGHA